MLDAVFATKLGMTQAWSKNGKRLAVTKCKVEDNTIVGSQKTTVTDKTSLTWKQQPQIILEVGYGEKKHKNMSKPLRTKITKSGFSFGMRQIKGLKYDATDESPLKIGDSVVLEQVLEVGDIVKVQGVSKGRGFAGGIKRHGFHGGPRTHGQSDRSRAVGSIGSGTDPGRVWKGKKMPGHYGTETKTILGLVVVYLNSETKELWLSGPVPGFNTSIIRITKTGKKKNIELNLKLINLNKDSSTEVQVEKIKVPKSEKIEVKEEAKEESEKEKEVKEESKQ